jgi:DNA mismatch repair protein MutL
MEQFGPRTIAIQSFPVLLDKAAPSEFVSDLLDLLLEQAERITREELIHHVLDMMACKAAVKAGDPLSDSEIRALLAQRHLITQSGTCPHGRPTTIRLSLAELEKQFKRT